MCVCVCVAYMRCVDRYLALGIKWAKEFQLTRNNRNIEILETNNNDLFLIMYVMVERVVSLRLFWCPKQTLSSHWPNE